MLGKLTFTFERLESFNSPFIAGVKSKAWKPLLDLFEYYKVKVRVHEHIPEEVITLGVGVVCILFKPKHSHTWCLIPEKFITRNQILTCLSLEYISTKNNDSILYCVSPELKTGDEAAKLKPQTANSKYFYLQHTEDVYSLLTKNIDIKVEPSRFSIFSPFVDASCLHKQIISNYAVNRSTICGALFVSNQVDKGLLIKNSLDPSKMSLLGYNDSPSIRSLPSTLPNSFNMPSSWRYKDDVRSVSIENHFNMFNKLISNVYFNVSKIITPGLAEELTLAPEHALKNCADLRKFPGVVLKLVKTSLLKSTYIPRGSYAVENPNKLPLVITDKSNFVSWINSSGCITIDHDILFLETPGVYVGLQGLVISNTSVVKTKTFLHDTATVKLLWKTLCFEPVNYSPSTATLPVVELKPIPMRQVYNL